MKSSHRRILLLALLLLYFSQGMAQIRHASITFDEALHLGVGYVTLRTGDFRLQPLHIHPPLANELAAAPLLLQDDLPDPRTLDGWEQPSISAVIHELIWEYPHPARLALAGRLPILWMGMLLAALIYRWARERGGPVVGLLALALVAVDPNLIAHGTLITTDMGATLASMATLYALDRTCRRPSWGGLVATGLLLGLAQLTKVSGLALIPIVGLILLIRLIPHKAYRPWPRLIGALALPFLVTAGVIWAGYNFQLTAVPPLPIPIPAGTHLQIYQALQEHYQFGHPSFLLGRLSDHGWLEYFPLAFLIKTPLPALLLWGTAAAIGLTQAVRKLFSRSHLIQTALEWAGTPLLVFPIAYAASSLLSTVNIGYRHLLPLLPVFYIAAAPGISLLFFSCAGTAHEKNKLFLSRKVLLIGLWLWMAVGTLRTAPYPMTFFNETVGGPSQGYKALVDSNLDWGQNLWDLKTWLNDHGETRIYYAHYSPADPAMYGITVDYLPPSPNAGPFKPWAPAPGLYAIGATVLQGPYAPDENTFAWFRNQEPIARLGNALFIYRVEPQPELQWAARCTTEQPLRATLLITEMVGNPAMRILTPNCARGWVYPAETTGPGLYFGTPDSLTPPGGKLEFTLRSGQGWEWPVYRVTRPELPIDPGIAVEGPLNYRGALLNPPQSGDHFWAYWEVRTSQLRPLSLMAHAIDPAGTPPLVDDGLCLPIDQWQSGDLLIQRHRFNGGTAPTGYQILTGGYWLDTVERWPIRYPDGRTADAIQIAP